MKKSNDTLQRFLFEHAPIRGEFVCLESVWQSVIERHEYPELLRNLVGELTAAAVLLAATLKLDGAMILQIHGDGPLKLVVVECSGDLDVRATAKWQGELPVKAGLSELVGNGRFVITLDPKDGGQTYQGIVAMEGGSVAEILQNYMMQSEQLDTHLWLAASGERACGMLLQKLPERSAPDPDAWSRVVQLAGTVRQDELLSLPIHTLLHRLFHEDDIRLFEAQPVQFSCSCSRESVGRMLKLIGRDEAESILVEQGEIEVHCEFCNQRYVFDPVDVEGLFRESWLYEGGETRH